MMSRMGWVSGIRVKLAKFWVEFEVISVSTSEFIGPCRTPSRIWSSAWMKANGRRRGHKKIFQFFQSKKWEGYVFFLVKKRHPPPIFLG